MSYPPISNYYGSSNQSSNSGNNAYSPNRGSGNYNYPSSINGSSNATYSSSSYNYAPQSSYTANSNVEAATDPYASNSGYGYQRNGNYQTQDTSMNDTYGQNYYDRNNAGSGQQSQVQAEGLSNLAYASGLETVTSRSSTSRGASQYGNTQTVAQQTRLRSPAVETSRYSTNPPTSTTSYPMQQQMSTSSNSSQQLAVNAAAALAGAVSRRYSNQQGQKATTSPSVSAARAVANSIPQRTASPQISNMNHQQPSYTSMQSKQPSYPSQQYVSAYDTPPTSTAPSRSSQAGNSNARQSGKSRATQSAQARPSTSAPRRDIQQTGSIANLVSAAYEAENEHAPVSSAQESAPGFIDPTAVFDPYHRERERKKQEAVANAKRQAEKDARAEEVRKQQESEHQQPADANKQNAASKSKQSSAKKKKRASKGPAQEEAAAPEMTEEGKMAQEIKSMMDKMKAFQSKDPLLFKKLWKESQTGSSSNGANQSPSPQILPRNLPKAPSSTPTAKKTPAPQPVPQTAPASQLPIAAPENAEKTSRRKSAKIGPDGQKLHLNGYPVVVENNPEGLPDLGRFPAERRVRPNKYNKKEKNAENSPEPTLLDNNDATTPAPSTAKRPGSSKSKSAAPAALSGALSAATGMTATKASAATNAASGTVWPLEKRNALTATALKALKAIPENESIPLTEDDLRKMLEHNPSYITLCGLLEARGLKFHRGHFARELLNSVPELKAPTAGQKSPRDASQPAPNGDIIENGTQPVESVNLPPGYVHPPGIPTPPPGYMVQFHPPDQPPMGHFIAAPQQWGQGPLYPSSQGHPPPSSQAKKPKIKVTHRPEPPPGSKEAAARKRGFADLIDLTELNDDDNYVLPDKHPRLDGPDSDVEMEENPLQAFQRTPVPPPPQQISIPLTAGWYPPPSQPMLCNPQQSEPQIKKDAFAESKNQRMILAKTLNRAEALKKQYYDPKTVARDILIASGRHPYERPLNVHLAGMLGKYIDLDSDVSSFEWEELDPGGPPIPEVEYVDIPATKPRFKLGERGIKRQRSRVNIADRTRQPETEMRPNTVAPPVATAQEQPTLDSQLQVAKPKKPSGLRQSLLASDTHATPATFDPTRLPQVQSDRSQINDSITLMADNPTPGTKKRGRPVGSKNKYPSMASLRSQAAGLSVNVPTRDTTAGRDKFKCKWKKCSVVLHNLDTLRKHIGRNHRPSSDEIGAGDGYTCWWKHCPFIKKDEEGEFYATKKFDDREEWIRHIEREHITPIAMKYGDGPSVTHVDPLIMIQDREAYCANEKKQGVTPIIINEAHNASLPDDPLTLTEAIPLLVPQSQLTDQQKNDKTAFTSYMGAHHFQSRDLKVHAREVIRAMEVRKRTIGPGVDRGGCTLVTQEMREGFVDNPGVRRVIR